MHCLNEHIKETATILLLIGGHSVSSALLKGQLVTAVSEAMTVCVCVLIFLGVSRLVGHLQPSAIEKPRSHSENGQQQ